LWLISKHSRLHMQQQAVEVGVVQQQQQQDEEGSLLQ
jgi:hypothetical protein